MFITHINREMPYLIPIVPKIQIGIFDYILSTLYKISIFLIFERILYLINNISKYEILKTNTKRNFIQNL